MKKILFAAIIIVVAAGCNGKHADKLTDTLKDTSKKELTANEMPDSSDFAGPSFDEVKSELLSTYNKVDTINKLFIDGKDTLHLYCKYYCLHDSSLVIPKKYNWGEKNATDFVTHNFATKIVLLKNNDTVFNKVVTRADFNSALYEQLRKYAILFSPHYIGYDKNKGELAIGYSISIPLTDVGVPAYIAVDKKGNYRILDEYVTIDNYKK